MIRLKKCPFCGGEAILRSWAHVDGNYYTVECPKCYVDMGEYETIEEVTKAWNRRVPERKKGKWAEKFDRIIRELGVNCAYDMPSFWCNQGKDYKVIPTQYHKGYMQALADVEKHMKGAEE